MNPTAKDDMGEIVHKSLEIIKSCKTIKEKSQEYMVATEVRPDIASELLAIIMNAEDLMEYVEPMKETGEIFGLPEEAFHKDKHARSFKNSANWDFNPWFLEKSTNIKKNIIRYYWLWEKGPTEYPAYVDDPQKSKELHKHRLDSAIQYVQHNAEAIFQLTCGDKISIE